MYTNAYEVLGFATRDSTYPLTTGTPAPIGIATATFKVTSTGDYDTLFLCVAVASTYPSYDDRDPHLRVEYLIPADKPLSPWDGTAWLTATVVPYATAATGNEKLFYLDISNFSIGKGLVRHTLLASVDPTAGEGVGTARGTYAITVIGKRKYGN